MWMRRKEKKQQNKSFVLGLLLDIVKKTIFLNFYFEIRDYCRPRDFQIA